MRTYKQIYEEYCSWVVLKTGNLDYTYDALIEKYGEQQIDVFLYKDILNKCYDKNDGMFYFCKFIIGDLLDIGYPRPYRFNTLSYKWNELIKKYKYICVECARGHGKSNFLSIVRNIYDTFIFKYKRVIIISASQEQANEHLENMKSIIDNNEWLSSKKDSKKWATERISYNGGFIMASGIGSEILGHHVDRICLDDILRTDNKMSDDEVEDYVDMNLMPMLLNRKGQMVIVGTKKAITDIFHVIQNRIKETPGCPWVYKKYKAILDYDNKILQCPDRFTWKEIMEKRLSMGPQKFAREYQLELFSRDQSLFSADVVNLSKEKGKDMRLLTKADNRSAEWNWIIGVDVARSGAASADYTVAIVLAHNSITNEKQLVHIWRSKGMKIVTQAKHIADIARRFNHATVLVEQNNMGQDMIDDLGDLNVGVESFLTGGKGQKKEELVRFLITSFEREHISIPQGDEHSKEQMNILVGELESFCVTYTRAGNEHFKGMGNAKDDCVIAMCLANKATQMFGTPFAMSTFGEGSGATRETNPYGSLLSSSSKESDLVQMIKMGLIK